MSSKDELAPAAPAPTEAGEREALRNALGGVLTNVSNYPESVQSRLWGTDLWGLIEKATDAALAARRAPIEDAEPVAYEVRDRKGTPLSIVRPDVTSNFEPEFYTLTPLYRHPTAPIEVTDE